MCITGSGGRYGQNAAGATVQLPATTIRVQPKVTPATTTTAQGQQQVTTVRAIAPNTPKPEAVQPKGN